MTRLEKFLYANASEMIKSDTTVSLLPHSAPDD